MSGRPSTRQFFSCALSDCAALLFVIIVVLQCAFPLIAKAATGAPKILNYQGRLLDSSGNLLGGAGTDYCFRFSIYDNASVGSGSKVWPSASPSTMTIVVKNGVFNAGVGDTNAGGDLLDYNFQDNDSVYLNVDVAAKVGATCAPGDGAESFETLSPRERVLSSGFALNANTVGGFAAAQEATGNQIPVLESGTLVLGGSSPSINATSTNPLTFQNGGWATGDIRFFNASNWINASGNASFAGAIAAVGVSVTNATTSNATISGVASTSNLVVSNAFRFGTLSGILKSVAGVVMTTFVNLATDVSGILPVANGGTGWAYFAAGAIPYGDLTGGLATTSAAAAGQVLAYLGGVPTWTATTSFAAPLAYANGTVSLPQASSSADGYLSQANWNTFNGKVSSSSLSAAYPLAYNSATGVFSSVFSTTTDNAFSGNDIFNGATQFNGSLIASGSTTLANATTTSFAIASLTSTLLASNENGSVVSTTTIGANLLGGVLGITHGGSGTSSVPAYGKLLVGNNAGSYDLVSTTSLGIASAVWGNITGTLSDQTDLENALNAKFDYSAWYATTTDALKEGSTNKYYQDSRVQTYLDTLGKGYFFATSSADYWKTANNFFSTTSAAFWDSTVSRWATTSASYFLSQNQGAAFSTTSANYLLTNTDKGFFFATTSADYWKSVTTFTGASTTLLTDTNTWSKLQIFANASSTLTTLGTTWFSGITNGILATDETGKTIASSTIGANYITGALGSINGTSLARGGAITITAASSSLLSDTNTWSALQLFTNASSTNLSASGIGYFATASTTNSTSNYATTSALYITGKTNALLATDNNGQVIATSSIGANYITGALATINGISVSRGDNATIAAASTTLLSNNNTFAGANIFSGTLALANGTSTAFAITSLANAAGAVLAVNPNGSVIATSSISTSILNGTLGVANGGTGAGTFTYGLLLANGTNALAHVATSSLGLLTTDVTEGTNKYYQDSRVQTYLDTLGKGYFFATSSADYWKTANNFFSTTSAAFWDSTVSRWATTSASYFLSQNQGAAFSTTSANYLLTNTDKGFFFATTSADYWKSVTTFTGASTTLLTDNNTFSGNLILSNATSSVIFSSFFVSPSAVFGTLNATSSAMLASTTILGRFIAGNLIATSTATSSFIGSLAIGTSSGSYQASVLHSVTGPSSQTGSAVMAITNSSTAVSSANGVLRLNISTPSSSNCTTGTTCPRFMEFFAGVPSGSDSGGIGVGSLRLSTNGTGITQTSGSADFAEYMQLNSSASAGDLVSLNSSGEYQKAVAGQSIIGVVSDSPAFVGNGNLEGSANAYIVGFAGVIPATVSAANGAINAGDFITASTTAGVGVKLTTSGYALGQALQSFSSGGTGTINVLVFPKFIDASVALQSYGGSSGGESGYWSLATSTGVVTLASSTYSLMLTSATTSTLAISSLANTLVAANENGSLVATSSLGANLIAGTLGVAHGGTGAASFAYGLLLANGTNALAHVATSSLGLLTTDITEGTNKYYQDSRVQTYLDTLGKGYFFATSSAAYWQGTTNFFSTTSAAFWDSTVSRWATTSASYFLSQNQGVAFSTTSANAYLATKTTDDLLQSSTNKYYSSLLFAGDLAATTTTALAEGSHLYYTDARVSTYISGSSTIPHVGGSAFGDILSWTGSTWATRATSTLGVALGDTTGVLGIGHGGTGTSTAPAYGKLLVGNSVGGYNLIATSSLGITSAVWGNITGTLSDQTDIENALNAKVDNTIGKGYFFSTTSASYFSSLGLGFSTTSATYWQSQNNFFSTTSVNYWKSVTDLFSTTSVNYWKSATDLFSTTSASYFLSQNQGTAFSTTSANYFSSLGLGFSTTSAINFVGASTTIPKTFTANVWSALQSFSGKVGIGTTSPWAKFAISANSGETNTMLFQIASSTANATTSLFSVDNTGLTTVGDSSGSGDANLTFGVDANAWNIGYASSDKSFRIASSTNFTTGTMFSLSKSGIGKFYGDVQLGTLASCGGALKTDINGQIFCGAAGSSGGSGLWATSTNDQLIYPTVATVPVVVGQTSTTTTGNIFEAGGSALIRGAITAYSTITAPTFSATSTTASSTFANGINLTGGCFAINGTCFTGGGGGTWGSITGTLSSQTDLQNALDAKVDTTIDKGFFFSTTSAAYWQGTTNFFSTTSVNYWKSVTDLFSTTSASYFLSQNQGAAFSTTSASYWSSLGLGFATSSADYWKTTNNFFSTTSAAFWDSTVSRWATTSASYFLSQNQGVAFSTTSANAYLATKTTDDLLQSSTNKYYSSLLFAGDLAATTTTALAEGSHLYYTDARVSTYISGSSTIPHVGGSAFGDILSWTGSTWATRATSTLGVALGDTTGVLDEANGGTGKSGFAKGDILYGQANGTLAVLSIGATGQVLKVTGGVPQWGADLTSGGGGGGGGVFSTTTDGLIIYPTDTSHIVTIGTNATSSDNQSIFEVAGKSYFSNKVAIATTSPGTLFSIGSVANFDVAGSTLYTPLSVTQLAVTGAATSTAENGIDIGSGCFAMNGTCIGGASWGAITGTLSNQTDLQNALDAKVDTTIDKGFFFSTTSAAYWQGTTNFFSTTSVNYWKSVTDLFSTTSASYFLSKNQGAAFSTTSASYFSSLGLGFSTTSATYWQSQNNFFSTTSVNYWKSVTDLFSTTSVNYWKSATDLFSTTSASYFLSQNQGTAFSTTSANYFSSLGLGFSTTSAINFVGASTTIPKTFTANVWSALQSFSGKVGIGTTSPWAKFAISANSGETNTMLFQIASSTANATTSLFSVDNTGLTTVGDSSGTGDAVFQYAGDTNAWSVGYYATDKSFNIASSTNLSGGPASAALSIAKNGNLTIHGSGTTCVIGGGAGATNCTSDERLKTNIFAISGSDALMRLAQISGVTFNWADPSRDQSQQVGVIAQKVQQAFPQLVGSTTVNFKGTPGTYYTVDYAGLTAPLISAVNYLSSVYAVSGATTSAASIVSDYQGTTTPALSIDASGDVTLSGALTVIDATLKNATTTTLYSAEGHIGAGRIDTLSAANATVSSLTALSASLASATTTHLAITGIGSGLLAVRADGSVAPVSIDRSLSFTGGTVGLDLGHANVWSGLQVFGYASTTALSALDYIGIGRASTTTIRGDGATSTFAGGIDLTAGCFAVNGTCVGDDSGHVKEVKSADQSVTDSTTLTDDRDLSFPVKAGETWVFEYFLNVNNNSSASAGWKSAILAPGASSCTAVQSGTGPMGSTFFEATTTDCAAPGTLENGAISASTSSFPVEIQGIVTAGSNGVVKLQFAEHSSGAGSAITVKSGSYVAAYKVGGADLAQVYATADPSITAATIVAVDPQLSSGVKRAERSVDDSMLGVVSTEPQIASGDLDQVTSGTVLVALAGRVPTSVSLENGPIAPGDRIALSSEPGVGMKASVFDDSIGIALEGYDGTTTPEIMTLVQPARGVDINHLAFSLLSKNASSSFADASSTNLSTGVFDFVGGMMDAIGKRLLSWNATDTASSDSSSTAETATSTTIDTYATSFMDSLESGLRAFFASATNGIGEMFADTFRAKTAVCVGDECLSADDIRALHALSESASADTSASTDGVDTSSAADASTTDNSTDSSPTPTSSPADSTATSTATSSAATLSLPPILSVKGDASISINVGDSYTDAGATITGPAEDLGLTIQSFVDGVAQNPVTIDTSVASDHTVSYRATDASGQTGEASRTVHVVAPAPAQSSPDAPATDATSGSTATPTSDTSASTDTSSTSAVPASHTTTP